MLRTDLAQHLNTIHTGEIDVQEHHREGPELKLLQGFGTVACDLDFQPLSRQYP